MKLRLYNSQQSNIFPFYTSTIAINYLQSRINRPEGFKLHQLFAIVKGNGILKLDGKIFKITQDDLFYIEKNFPHEYYGTDEEFTTLFISFDGFGFEGIKQYYKLEKYGVFKCKNKGTFTNYVKSIYSTIEQQELSVLCAETYTAIISFFEEACKKSDKGIEAVYKFILANYSKPLNLDDILTVYPYSKSKLCKDFKNKYNCTIFDFLTITRLKHAKYLLTNHPNLKLKEIAQSCGFNDVSYFCKFFKKIYGSSPKSNI